MYHATDFGYEGINLMKKIRKLTAETLLVIFGGLLIFGLMIIFVPLVSFNNKSVEEIGVDAARAYGLSRHEYRIEEKEELLNDKGKNIQGAYAGYEYVGRHRVHIVQVKKQSVRVFMIATIFHELAHAAQDKYNLDFGKYTREQHAEILCFKTMVNNNYWWESIHLLSLHTFFSKPSEYRVPTELWQIAFTGTSKALG